MPFTSFSEFNKEQGSHIWFVFGRKAARILRRDLDAAMEKRPQGEERRGDRGLYGFLTTEPNAVVGPIHPKAMPVILTTAEERDVWLRRREAGRAICSARCPTTL